MMSYQIRKENEIIGALRGKPYQPGQCARNRNYAGISQGRPPPPAQQKSQAQSLIDDAWKGMGRVNRHGRQQGIKFFLTVFPDKTHSRGIQLMQSQHPDALRGQRRTQPGIPTVILFVDKFVGQLAEQIAFFSERKAIGTGLVVPVFNLLHHRRHPHFKKFVQIAGRDGQELQPFEQRIAFIAGFFQHTAVEREPGNVAIEKILGIV